MNTALSPMPKFQAFDAAGRPAAGAKLYTAQPGTIAGADQSFPKSTYTDYTGQTANTNPVIFDISGRADVWLQGGYSMALYDANDILLWSTDGVSPSGMTGSFNTGAIDPNVTYVWGDATSATYNANILAANDPAAVPIRVFKIDDSANLVTITPASGTVLDLPSTSLATKGESITLIPYALGNNWFRG